MEVQRALRTCLLGRGLVTMVEPAKTDFTAEQDRIAIAVDELMQLIAPPSVALRSNDGVAT
ncbi:hypothetical protein Q5425_21180 [Amycolatopsis sp. A133]|nr:hypothetical protein [Amycolatopsis sp. A133]